MEATAATERKGTEAAGPMFDNRGFGLPGQGVATPDSERSKDHWQAWEHGYLLNRALNGWPHERIAGALERTGAAVRRKLLRLLDGDDVCPPDCVDLLKVARQRMNHPAKPPVQSATGAAVDADKLARYLNDMFAAVGAELARIRLIQQFALARGVASERIDIREVDMCLPSDVHDAVAEIAKILDTFRRQNLLEAVKKAERETGQPPLPLTGVPQGGAAIGSQPAELVVFSESGHVLGQQTESDATAAAREREED